MLELYIVLIGLAMASFIGSLSYRVPRSISILAPPSFCPSCRRRLRVYEIIPVASYLAFRGRCRTCGYRIPMQFLIIEILTPLVYLALYRAYGTGALFFAFIYLISLLLYLSLVDIDAGSVSAADIAAVYGGGLAVLFLSWRGLTGHTVRQSLYGFALCVGLLGMSVLVLSMLKKRRSIGIGDLFILPGTALYVGLDAAIRVLLFSSLIGLVVGVTLVLLRRVARDYRFPLMPFVTGGVCVEILLFYHNIVL